MGSNATSEKPAELCTIVMVPRDRYSMTLGCLEHLVANTPEPYKLIVVTGGGAPEKLERELKIRYGNKAELIFDKRFLNPAQSRNIGLRAAKTRLAVLVDNDVYVRPGWFTPLIRCQIETGAAMVVPLILEKPNVIHTAGNQFYVNYKNGRAYGHKVLLCQSRPYHEGSNLKRSPTDYGELHCQLVEVETALRLGAYDENIREVGELDSGLTWQKAGRAMVFEPASVVFYSKPKRITEPSDIAYFKWRWDMRGILEGYRHFEKKWNMDVQGQGSFKFFLVDYNSMVGLLARTFPSKLTLFIDHRLAAARLFLQKSLKLWRRLRAHALGFGEWD